MNSFITVTSHYTQIVLRSDRYFKLKLWTKVGSLSRVLSPKIGPNEGHRPTASNFLNKNICLFERCRPSSRLIRPFVACQRFPPTIHVHQRRNSISLNLWILNLNFEWFRFSDSRTSTLCPLVGPQAELFIANETQANPTTTDLQPS